MESRNNETSELSALGIDFESSVFSHVHVETQFLLALVQCRKLRPYGRKSYGFDICHCGSRQQGEDNDSAH